jgi:hypothetical protein
MLDQRPDLIWSFTARNELNGTDRLRGGNRRCVRQSELAINAEADNLVSLTLKTAIHRNIASLTSETVLSAACREP